MYKEETMPSRLRVISITSDGWSVFLSRPVASLLFMISPTALTRLLLRSHTTVTVDSEDPGWRAGAVVRPRGVHTVAILTVVWVLTLIHICTAKRFIPDKSSGSWIHTFRFHDDSLLTGHCRYHTLLFVGVRSPRLVTLAEEGAFGVDALAVGAQRLIVAFVHICTTTVC